MKTEVSDNLVFSLEHWAHGRKDLEEGVLAAVHNCVTITLLNPASFSLPNLLGSGSSQDRNPTASPLAIGSGERASSRIEQVAARLVPFDMSGLGGPLAPIAATGGLVFQYSPSISESIEVTYNSVGSLVHSNENYNVWSGTQNRKIGLGEVVFTADTEENAAYMIATIQFFRVFSLSDFGRGKTGRPPSPMWFSAYGRMMYEQVPVLLKGATLEFSNTVDYVRVPTAGFARSSTVATATGATSVRGGALGPSIPSFVTDLQNSTNGLVQRSSESSDFVWVPAKLSVSGISLIVQHTPNYWKGTFSLEEFKSGGMLEKRETSPIQNSSGSMAAAASSVSRGTSELFLREKLKAAALAVTRSGGAGAGAQTNADKPIVADRLLGPMSPSRYSSLLGGL